MPEIAAAQTAADMTNAKPHEFMPTGGSNRRTARMQAAALRWLVRMAALLTAAVLVFLISPRQCLYFVGLVLVLQQFDGNILGPKILGDSTGLASFWVLFSILLFGGLFGFVGMVLGVPVFAMFYSVVSRLVRCGLKKRGLPLETEQYLGRTGPLAGTGPGVEDSGTR